MDITDWSIVGECLPCFSGGVTSKVSQTRFLKYHSFTVVFDFCILIVGFPSLRAGVKDSTSERFPLVEYPKASKWIGSGTSTPFIGYLRFYSSYKVLLIWVTFTVTNPRKTTVSGV